MVYVCSTMYVVLQRQTEIVVEIWSDLFSHAFKCGFVSMLVTRALQAL